MFTASHSIIFSFLRIFALMERIYQSSLLGKRVVFHLESHTIASTGMNQNPTTLLFCIHRMNSVSSLGSVTKNQDHFPAEYRQSGDENEILSGIFDGLFSIFSSF